MSASQPPPLNPLPSGPIGPVTAPRGATTPKRVAIIVLAVVVLLGGLAFGVSRLVRRPADYRPPPALPKVIDDPVVTEAIDLFKKPKLGTPWNASGGAVPGGLRSIPFITPCGVLVTVVQSGAGSMTDPQTLSQARVVGYDIASGQQKWSFGLQQATGLTEPKYALFSSEYVAYTGDCHMVLNFGESDDATIGATASLFIDLASGDVTTMSWTSDQQGWCAAAGDSWAGCSKVNADESMAVKLDGSTKPAWTQPADRHHDGDLVVAGFIRSDAGYRDPATGRVAFGADVTSGQSAVMYVEPRRPGGYRSGLVVRVTGPLGEGSGQCQVTVWDPATNRSAWPTPQSIACGDEYSYEWGVAGQALIVESGMYTEDNPTTAAYRLADGTMLWQRDGNKLGSQWDRIGDQDLNSSSLSEAYVFLTVQTSAGYDHLAIRIADGVETNLTINASWASTKSLNIAAGVMAYDIGSSDLTAYAIDAAKPDAKPSRVWSIPFGPPLSVRSTFATGGVMYLVYDLREDGLQVAPLLS